MKISRCIAAALLAVSTTAAGCSSCAKDESAPPAPSTDTSATPLTNQKAAPLPRFFERHTSPKIESLSPQMSPSALANAPVGVEAGAADAGTDATR